MDLIDRQAAIDAILAVTGNSSVRELYEHVQEHGLSDMWSGGVNAAIDIIIAVPSARPVAKDTNVPINANDCISRQAAIDALNGEVTVTGRANAKAVLGYANLITDRIKRLPSVHPGCDEWCTDCKEYDQQKHYCPRFCRVIRKTVEELKSEQPETCEGCKHLGKWENEVEYGYSSPCTCCKRRAEDHYER